MSTSDSKTASARDAREARERFFLARPRDLRERAREDLYIPPLGGYINFLAPRPLGSGNELIFEGARDGREKIQIG